MLVLVTSDVTVETTDQVVWGGNGDTCYTEVDILSTYCGDSECDEQGPSFLILGLQAGLDHVNHLVDNNNPNLYLKYL